MPLSVVVCLGLLAGMMAGDPQALLEHTRSIISQMVESIFVPLFFAGISNQEHRSP